jgi:hypothetical protein
VTGHKTVRIACVCLLALGLLVAVSASSGAAANLAVSISGPASNPVAGGGPFELAVQTTNNDANDSGDVTTTLSLPPGVTLHSSTPTASNCSGVGTVLCDRGVITAGSTDTFTVDLQADHTVSGDVDVLASSSDGSLTSNTDDDTVTVDTNADLALSDLATPSSSPGVTAGDAVAGGSISYALTIDNPTGPSDNQGFKVRDTLPVGATLSAPVSGCLVTTPANGSHGDVVECTHTGVLAAGSGTVTYTLPVAVSPSQPATSGYSDSATIFQTSTSDPNTANDSTSDPVNLVTRADLVPTITAPSGDKTAGDPAGFDFTVKVKNAGPSDNTGGYTATGTLAPGLTFVSSGSCSGSGTSFTCPDPANSGIPYNQTDTYTVHVKVLASACPAGPSATPLPCDGNVTSSVSVASNGTADPSTPASSNTASALTSIVTKADLEAQSMTSTASSLFANIAAANATTFTYQFTNHGLSDAQHVVVSLPDHPLASADPTYFKIDNLCRVTGTVTCTNPGDFGTGTDIGEVDGGATVTVVIHAHANPGLGHNSPDPIATGSFVVKSTATVATSTTDPGVFPNVRNNLSPNVTISTVASPPRNPFGIPGTGNAILTWQNPASNGGQAIQNFLITVTPAVGPPFTLPVVPFNATPTSACGAVAATNCYQLTVTGLQNDNGAYTFAIQAQNAVGASDAAATTATPSVNAKNASVPTNTSTTLTTCTTATLATKVCVVYTIPSGAGGVFGAGGLVALPTGLCNGTCINDTGAQNLGSLAGYNDRTRPLIETITWDSSLVAPSLYTNVPACPNNSTSTTCYPNNVKIYYEDTFSLLHCGVGFTGTCDPNTLVDHSLFPVVPGTVLNLHFCAQAINSGGAGNKNYARPKPSPLGVYNGYNDPSGSACIKSMNALGSVNSSGANRDIQVVINMTSDSDGLAGRH